MNKKQESLTTQVFQLYSKSSLCLSRLQISFQDPKLEPGVLRSSPPATQSSRWLRSTVNNVLPVFLTCGETGWQSWLDFPELLSFGVVLDAVKVTVIYKTLGKRGGWLEREEVLRRPPCVDTRTLTLHNWKSCPVPVWWPFPNQLLCLMCRVWNKGVFDHQATEMMLSMPGMSGNRTFRTCVFSLQSVYIPSVTFSWLLCVRL